MRLEYKHLVAIIYSAVLFLDRLDLTVVNIALPTVAHKAKYGLTGFALSLVFLANVKS